MGSSANVPLVIGMPVYNGADYVEDAVLSLLDQTFGDFLLVISDNASTDRTPEVLAELASKDSRVVVLTQSQNVGANENFNVVARWALARRPPYFKWAAADDICAPRFLEVCIDALEQNPDAVLAYPVSVHIDASGNPMPDLPDPGPHGTQADPLERFEDIVRDQYGGFYVFGVMRTEALARTTLFGPHWPCDKSFSAWMSLQGRFVQVDEPLFLRRTHADQSSSLDSKVRAKWSGGRTLTSLIPGPLWATRDYLRAIRSVPLTSAQRRAALGLVAHLYVEPDKWARLLKPGRDNYLGITGREGGDKRLKLPEPRDADS